MQSKITTTITTLIDLDTFTPEHAVEITSDELPQSVATAAVIGACRALLAQLGAPVPTPTEEDASAEADRHAREIEAEIGDDADEEPVK